jgi:hypothetical protein
MRIGPDRTVDDEARAYEWEEAQIAHGLLDPDQPTEAAHMRYLDRPHVRLLREEAGDRHRREQVLRRGWTETP